jgi:rSAM/selenodomain-associated transferase 1
VNRGRLLVFARDPIPGQAKTRLIPVLGPEGAAALHARLTRQTLKTACSLDDIPVTLCCTPDTESGFFRRCREDFPLELYLQHGENLGQRMLDALQAALKKADWAILMGTDCPGLSANDLQQACRILEQHDAVLGPAHDGGYYLLGVKSPSRELLRNIPWGTDRVADLTRSRMHALGWSHQELRLQHDLDRPEDLSRLLQHFDTPPF